MGDGDEERFSFENGVTTVEGKELENAKKC